METCTGLMLDTGCKIFYLLHFASMSPVAIRVIKEQFNLPSIAISNSPQTFEHIDMLSGMAANSKDYYLE